MPGPGSLTSVNVQKNVISGSVNGSMFLNLLMGIYSVVYAGTLYLYSGFNHDYLHYMCLCAQYFFQQRPKKVQIGESLSQLLQLLLCLSDFLLQWYWLNQWIVVDGDTRESIFLSTLGGVSPSLFVFNNFLFYSVFIVSDGLLIWRCYHVWGSSLRVIVIPAVLSFAEISLFLASTILGASEGPQGAESILFNNIITALVLVSLGTTVITTALIGYRIYKTVSRLPSTSKKSFQHILVMIVESAATYSLILLFYAIFAVVPSFGVVDSPEFYAGDYVVPLASIVAGMAPTIIVARIALKNMSNTATQTINLMP